MSVAAAAAAAAVVVVVVVVVTRAWKFEPTIKKKGCPDVAFYSVRKGEFVHKPQETTIDPGAAPSDARRHQRTKQVRPNEKPPRFWRRNLAEEDESWHVEKQNEAACRSTHIYGSETAGPAGIASWENRTRRSLLGETRSGVDGGVCPGLRRGGGWPCEIG